MPSREQGTRATVRKFLLRYPLLSPKEHVALLREREGIVVPYKTVKVLRYELASQGLVPSYAESSRFRKESLGPVREKKIPRAFTDVGSPLAHALRAVHAAPSKSNSEILAALKRKHPEVLLKHLQHARAELSHWKSIPQEFARVPNLKPSRVPKSRLALHAEFEGHMQDKFVRLASRFSFSPEFEERVREGLDRKMALAANRYAPNGSDGVRERRRYAYRWVSSHIENAIREEVKRALKLSTPQATSVLANYRKQLRGENVEKEYSPLVKKLVAASSKLPFSITVEEAERQRY